MEAPTHEETNTPTENMKRMDVTNPSPVSSETNLDTVKQQILSYKTPYHKN